MPSVEEIKVDGVSSENPSNNALHTDLSDQEFADESNVKQVAAFGDPDLLGISEEELDE